MERIVVDSGKINEYMRVMYSHLDEFKSVLRAMEKERDAVSWEGQAANACFGVYNRMLSEYLTFANKMMEFIDYLNGYVEGYDTFIDEIKNEFKKMKSKYDLEDKYGKDNI